MSSFTKDGVTEVYNEKGDLTGTVRKHLDGWTLEIPGLKRLLFFKNFDEALYNAR